MRIQRKFIAEEGDRVLIPKFNENREELACCGEFGTISKIIVVTKLLEFPLVAVVTYGFTPILYPEIDDMDWDEENGYWYLS